MMSFRRKVSASGRRQRAAACARLLFALTLIIGSAAQARNWNVQAGGSRLEFVPRELTIAPGDTLAKVARKFGTKIDTIEAQNPGLDPTRLKVGQKIKIR